MRRPPSARERLRSPFMVDILRSLGRSGRPHREAGVAGNGRGRGESAVLSRWACGLVERAAGGQGRDRGGRRTNEVDGEWRCGRCRSWRRGSLEIRLVSRCSGGRRLFVADPARGFTECRASSTAALRHRRRFEAPEINGARSHCPANKNERLRGRVAAVRARRCC